MNEELGKTQNLLENVQLLRGSWLSKDPRDAGLALVTWKFAAFPSSAPLVLMMEPQILSV